MFGLIRIFVFLVVLIITAWVAISIMFPERKPKEEKEKILTPLDKLKALLNKYDELTEKLRSIHLRGERLLNRDTCDPVTKSVLEAYSGYIEGFIKSAEDLSKKYRNSKEYLAEINKEGIQREIEMLADKVSDGGKAFEKILKEKRDTLENLRTIERNQEKKVISLWEIEATLQSLEASVMSVENDSTKEKDARTEMQRSISTLSGALDKTQKELEREEALQEEVVVS